MLRDGFCCLLRLSLPQKNWKTSCEGACLSKLRVQEQLQGCQPALRLSDRPSRGCQMQNPGNYWHSLLKQEGPLGLFSDEEGIVFFTMSPCPPGLRWVLLHLPLPEPDPPAVSERSQHHSPVLLQEELDRGDSPVKGSQEPCAYPVPNLCPWSISPAVPWAREGF